MTIPTCGDGRPALTVMTGGALPSHRGEVRTVIRTVPGGPTIVLHSDDGYRRCTLLIAQHAVSSCHVAILLGGAVSVDGPPVADMRRSGDTLRRRVCRCGQRATSAVPRRGRAW